MRTFKNDYKDLANTTVKIWAYASNNGKSTRLYFSEYKKRIKAGEHSPFAAMMADLAQLAERNRISPVVFDGT